MESDDTDDSTGREAALPTYTEYLGPATDEETSVVYVDIATVWGRDEEFDTDEDSDVSDLDPVLGGSLRGMGVLIFAARLAFGSFGLAGLLDSDEHEAFETDVSEVFLADDAFVCRGTVDRDELDEHLQTPGGGLLASEYEQVGETDGYTIYASLDDGQSVGIGGTDMDTVAVGSDEFIVSGAAGVDRVIETLGGERERATDAFEPFEWLLSTMGGASSVIAGYGPGGFEVGTENEFVEENLPALQDATGLATSLSFETDTVETTTAAVFDDPVSETQRADIEAMAGDDASDHSCTVDGSRVVISASYDVEHISE
jgi:hypothetical protein